MCQVLLPDDMAVEHRNMNENPMYVTYMFCMCKYWLSFNEQ
jgi:hypothetical protein